MSSQENLKDGKKILGSSSPRAAFLDPLSGPDDAPIWHDCREAHHIVAHRSIAHCVCPGRPSMKCKHANISVQVSGLVKPGSVQESWVNTQMNPDIIILCT